MDNQSLQWEREVANMLGSVSLYESSEHAYIELQKASVIPYATDGYIDSTIFRSQYWTYVYPSCLMAAHYGTGKVFDEAALQDHSFIGYRPSMDGFWNGCSITFFISKMTSRGVTQDDQLTWLNKNLHADNLYQLLIRSPEEVIDYLKSEKIYSVDYSKFLSLRPQPEMEIFDYLKKNGYTRGRIGMKFLECRAAMGTEDSFNKYLSKQAVKFLTNPYAYCMYISTLDPDSSDYASLEVSRELIANA